MNQPWQVLRPELLGSMKTDVERAFPNLRFVERDGRVLLKGSFPIIDEGKVLDRYQLEIEFPADYPGSLPVVRETGGRIPRTADRHVNPADGTLCVGLPDALWMDGTAKAPLINFLQGPVRTYLMSSSLVERGDPWPFGEWAHAGKGVFQYYSQKLATEDPNLIERFLSFAYDQEFPRHNRCPCDSGRNFRRCHSPLIREIKEKVPAVVLKRSLDLVRAENKKTTR